MTTITQTRWPQTAWPLGGILVLLSLGGAAWLTAARWRPRAEEAAAPQAAPIADGAMPARLSAQARANLGLISQPVKPTTYWRKIEVPGIVTDRPGVSERGLIAPVTGVVTAIRSHPGEAIEPGAPLVSLRLTSESLHTSQRELFKATREVEIARQRRQRLEQLAQEGALPKNRLIDIDNEIERASVLVEAYRQDLLARGLSKDQLASVAKGEFVTEITVHAPGSEALDAPDTESAGNQNSDETTALPFKFEFEDLKVSLGQQAEAGQVLCHLADHRSLLIEGRGFKEDMPLIQQAAKDGMMIELEFEVAHRGNWPPPPKELRIHHIENIIDPESRFETRHILQMRPTFEQNPMSRCVRNCR